MYALPISDTTAIAVDDADEDTWRVHLVDFASNTFDSFSVDGVGHVDFAHYDTGFGLLWVISDGTIFAIKRSAQQLFEVDMPEDRFFAYSMVGEGAYVYVSGEYSNLWRIALPAQVWEPLLTPEPKPPRSDDEEEQTRRVQAYAGSTRLTILASRSATPISSAVHWALWPGSAARRWKPRQLTPAARLVSGRVEGAQISLSADTPRAEIYLGDFDGGFEVIFADNLRAFHRTAMHTGRRYLGVAEYPPSSVDNLYVLEDGGPVPVETGAAREPLTLISLSSTGNALWAIDRIGIFRLSNGEWTLVDIDDLRSGIWPTGG